MQVRFLKNEHGRSDDRLQPEYRNGWWNDRSRPKTFHYIKDREFTPKGAGQSHGLLAKLTRMKEPNLTRIFFDGNEIEPMITFGTNPGMGMGISKNIPRADAIEGGATTYQKSLVYGL